jgi:hypothetical protein
MAIGRALERKLCLQRLAGNDEAVSLTCCADLYCALRPAFEMPRVRAIYRIAIRPIGSFPSEKRHRKATTSTENAGCRASVRV